VLGAVGDEADRDEMLPAETESDHEAWEALIDEVEGRLL
jgi:hypothetical protein